MIGRSARGLRAFLRSPTGLVLVGFLLIGGTFLALGNRVLPYGAIPYFFVLLMVLMHFMHGSHGGHHGHSGGQGHRHGKQGRRSPEGLDRNEADADAGATSHGHDLPRGPG